MRVVTFRGISYPVAAVTDIYLAVLMKFWNALTHDNPIALSADIDRSCARHLRIMIPDLPDDAVTDDGIRGMEAIEFAGLLKELSDIHEGERSARTESYLNSLIEGD
jgi:hypothetical protein